MTLLFLNSSIHAQVCQWARHFGGIGLNTVNCVSDNDNNIYASGIFQYKCILEHDTLTSNGQNDIFLIKYDENGNEIWSKKIGGANPYNPNYWENLEYFGDIIYDSAGNSIYLCGSFFSDITIDSLHITSEGQNDLFVTKLSVDGKCIWLKRAGSSQGENICTLSMDIAGNIYLSGNLSTAGVVDSTTISYNNFLSKFSPEGEQLWTKNVISNGFIYRAFVKNNFYYFAGYFSGTTLIDTTILSCNDDYDFFLGKYNLVNNHINWVKHFTGGNDYNNLTIDFIISQSNEIYSFHTYTDSVVFDNTILSNPTGNSDIFLLKCDSVGNKIWAHQFNTYDNKSWSYRSLSAGAGNTIYVAGSFENSAVFGLDTMEVENESTFITRLDNNGSVIGEVIFGAARNQGLSILNNGAIILTGSQIGTTQIGDTIFTTFSGSQSGSDNYLAKFDAITGMQTIGKPKDDKLFIYANPTSGLCTITIPSEFEHEKNLMLYVYDQQGRLLKEAKVELDAENIRLDMEALAKGMYTAVLSNGQKKFSGKIVFQ